MTKCNYSNGITLLAELIKIQTEGIRTNGIKGFYQGTFLK